MRGVVSEQRVRSGEQSDRDEGAQERRREWSGMADKKQAVAPTRAGERTEGANSVLGKTLEVRGSAWLNNAMFALRNCRGGRSTPYHALLQSGPHGSPGSLAHSCA